MTLRGPLMPYGVAFVGMLAAGAVLVVAALGDVTRLLWLSSGLSVVAILASIAAVVVPRR